MTHRVPERVVVLAGGYGGARMAHGFALLGNVELTVIANTADDLELHGLYISPDTDTVMYTLAGLANHETGWGVKDETWSARRMLATYGEPTWFALGDRDLATHIVRTARLRSGARLTEATAELCTALGVGARLLPMSDERVATKLRTAAGWLDFQDYFVRRRHADEVHEVRFEGLAEARPTAEALAAVDQAELIVIAPSNPFVSVGPILALPGMLDALRDARARVAAVSPIVGGIALRGPADRLLRSLAKDAGAAGVSRHYARAYPGLIDVFVLDEADAAAAGEVSQAGQLPLVTRTMLRTAAPRRRLAEVLRTMPR
jgi:LPPG:FO 2-phospho-L-lactate transferase